MDEVRTTGTRDDTYNLVSVIYHALQGAETYALYRQDAEEAKDEELTQFLQEVQQEESRRAERAKQLLSRRLGGAGQSGAVNANRAERSSTVGTTTPKATQPELKERGSTSKRSR